MGIKLKDLRRRDLPFVALCALTLALMGAYVRETLVESGIAPGGYRRVDIRAVKRLIQKGELSDRDAMYFRRVP